MQPVEVGSPYLHRSHLADELALLPDGILLSEGQDVEKQLDRCRVARPDLVVCGLRSRQSARSRRPDHQVVDRTDLHADPGYEQAPDLAELFARPLVRRTRLVA